MGDRVEPTDDNKSVKTPTPQQVGLTTTDLRRATDFLLDNVRLGNTRIRYDKYRRYVILDSSNIFNQLVELYAAMLRTQWQHFRRMMDAFILPPGVEAAIHAARVYISHWFIDLYCSNREATYVVSPLAFNERYSQEIAPYSNEYDAFLTLLNASVRPTHIQSTPEDSLYIPIISNEYNWTLDEYQQNPFGINRFCLNHDIFYGILQVMKERKTWKMANLSTHTTGRPCWLFDWHDTNRVCAWFPREANYNDSDVALAYIIGVACTPKLGPRDVDDWQYPENGRAPTDAEIPRAVRVVGRRFYGSYEVRQREVEEHYNIPDHIVEMLSEETAEALQARKRKKVGTAGTTSGTTVAGGTELAAPAEGGSSAVAHIPTILRYRLIDWCYHTRVILNMEFHTRTGALRIICIN